MENAQLLTHHFNAIINESEPNRLVINITGLGSITLNKTHEGLIIDVHNRSEEKDIVATMGIENNDFFL